MPPQLSCTRIPLQRPFAEGSLFAKKPRESILLVLVVVVVLGCFPGWLVQANLSPIAFSIQPSSIPADDNPNRGR
jgi:hypothetical protein